MDIVYGAALHRHEETDSLGKVRWGDSFSHRILHDDKGNLFACFAVSDGFAEYKISSARLASSKATNICTKSLEKFVKLKEKPEKILQNIFEEINSQIFDLGGTESVALGTTLTIAFYIKDTLYIAHVGNCRAYLFKKNGEIKLITTDQSYITPPTETNQAGEIVTNRLGTIGKPKVLLYKVKPEIEDALLLCSDGIHMHLSDIEMADLVKSGRPPSEVCNQMIEHARLRGLKDDAVSLLVKFQEKKERKEKIQKHLPKPKYSIVKILIIIFSVLLLSLYLFKKVKFIPPKLQHNKKPSLTIVSNIPLKDVRYNTKSIIKYFKNNCGKIKLKTQVSRFEIYPEDIYTLELCCPKTEETHIDVGKENIVTLEKGFVGIWICPKSSVILHQRKNNTTLTLKNLKGKIQVNLLKPQNTKIYIKEGY